MQVLGKHDAVIELCGPQRCKLPMKPQWAGWINYTYLSSVQIEKETVVLIRPWSVDNNLVKGRQLESALHKLVLQMPFYSAIFIDKTQWYDFQQ